MRPGRARWLGLGCRLGDGLGLDDLRRRRGGQRRRDRRRLHRCGWSDHRRRGAVGCRTGSSPSGSTYPSGSEATRMPRWTWGCDVTASALSPTTPTSAPSDDRAVANDGRRPELEQRHRIAVVGGDRDRAAAARNEADERDGAARPAHARRARARRRCRCRGAARPRRDRGRPRTAAARVRRPAMSTPTHRSELRGAQGLTRTSPPSRTASATRLAALHRCIHTPAFVVVESNSRPR